MLDEPEQVEADVTRQQEILLYIVNQETEIQGSVLKAPLCR